VHNKHFHKESLVGTCWLGSIHAYVLNSAIQLPISELYEVHKHGKKIVMFPSMYPDPDSTYNWTKLISSDLVFKMNNITTVYITISIHSEATL
jgi:hypothetical protein